MFSLLPGRKKAAHFFGKSYLFSIGRNTFLALVTIVPSASCIFRSREAPCQKAFDVSRQIRILPLIDEQADVFSFNQQTFQAFKNNCLYEILGQTE